MPPQDAREFQIPNLPSAGAPKITKYEPLISPKALLYGVIILFLVIAIAVVMTIRGESGGGAGSGRFNSLTPEEQKSRAEFNQEWTLPQGPNAARASAVRDRMFLAVMRLKKVSEANASAQAAEFTPEALQAAMEAARLPAQADSAYRSGNYDAAEAAIKAIEAATTKMSRMIKP
jgi:hypothetical protein